MYDEIFSDVKNYLSANEGEVTKIGHFPFRKRSEHIRRVFTWANRLMDDSRIRDINKDAVLIAALFHDIGYAMLADGMDHAENSAAIFEKYADEHGYDRDKSAFISYLIRSHSMKNLIFAESTPLELIVLMEADLLDETGALSIIWDCMVEGAQNEQSFAKTYDHITSYSGRILDENPMFTKKAKEIWTDKQRLVSEFIKQLAYDLGE